MFSKAKLQGERAKCLAGGRKTGRHDVFSHLR
jgi:hypothetical protein